MPYNPNNYRPVEFNTPVAIHHEDAVYTTSGSLLYCRACGAVIADPDAHELVDCQSPLND